MKYNLKIVGRGIQRPSRLVLSSELEKEQGYKKGSILDSSGVEKRFWASNDETNSTIGASAVQMALEDANLQFEDLDFLICGNATFDYPLPTTSSIIQKVLGKSNSGIPCMDVNSSCLSFLSALEVVAGMIHSGAYKRIAIVSSEIASKSLNPKTIETYGLFGDVAVAYIFEASEGESYLENFKFNTFSDGALYTAVKAGGNAMHHFNPESKKHPNDFYFQMEGVKVLKFTLKKLKNFVNQYRKIIDKDINEFKHIIPHQASKMSLKFFKNFYKLNDKQLHTTLKNYGNTIAASIPLTLYLAIEDEKIKRGDEILFIGTAAGITIGAVVMKY